LRYLLRAIFVVLPCLVSLGASAQSLPAATRLTLDAAAGFTSVRANEGPGQCGCFYMNGFNAELSVRNSHNTSYVINYATTSQTNINGLDQNLTLSTLTEGARYQFDHNRRWVPFGEAMFGLAHTSSNYEIYKSKNSPALLFGGGLDIKAGGRVLLRPVQADWVFTAFPNGATNIQNHLRLSAGLLIHLHKAPWQR
jgi:hypothetical protein